MSRELSQTECSTSNSCDVDSHPFRSVRSGRYRQARSDRACWRRQRRALKTFLVARGCTGRQVCSATGTNGAERNNSAASGSSFCSVLEETAVTVCTDFVAETLLPTTSGQYRLRAYRHTLQMVVVRVHDACFTSEVLGSLKCDCADQLQLAMDYIQEHPGGLIIYLQQEGRGIGLANKIAAYALQEQGFDTVDANRELGLPDDAREYTSVSNILADLDIRSIRLMTNNPRKMELLESLGVKVTKRIPCIVTAQKHNLGYLSAKRSRMRHFLNEEPVLDGSFCIWNHDGDTLPTPMVPEKRRGPFADLIDEKELQSERREEVRDLEKSMDEL